MNSNLIPLLYPLQPGFMDADQWIDQLLNRPDTINWQAAYRYSLDTDEVGACIFDVNTGFKVYEKFFTFKVDRMKKVVPGKPYVYQFEYKATYKPEEIMVLEALELPITNPHWFQMVVLK
jgi:hypothetical protein